MNIHLGPEGHTELHELRNHLQQHCGEWALRMAFDATGEQLQTFNDFMWKYVGDPFTHAAASIPEIVRHHPSAGAVNYDMRYASGITPSGQFVHVRGASRLNPVQHPAAQYFVAIADITKGTVQEWDVASVDHRAVKHGMMVTAIMLSNDMLAATAPSPSHDPLEDVVSHNSYVRSLPKVYMSSQHGSSLYTGEHGIEELEGVQEVSWGLGYYARLNLGALPLAVACRSELVQT